MCLVAFDDIGVLQTNLLARSQTHELLIGFLHEVIALNPEFTAELHLVGTVGFVLRIIDGCQMLNLILGIVGEHHLDGIQYRTDTDRTTVQVVTYGTLQQSHVIEGVDLRIADLVDELDDTLRAVATTAETADRRHTGVIPTVHQLIVY